MTDEPRWEDLFSSQPPAAPAKPPAEGISATGAPSAASGLPLTRRELREREGHTREPGSEGGVGVPPSKGGDSSKGRDSGDRPPKRRRRLAWLWVLLALLAIGGAAAAYGWANYEDQIRSVMGWELPNDYEGQGTGDEVVIVIQSGDIGADVARTLNEQGVTMTFDAFYELLLAQKTPVEFQPGNYSLRLGMSAQAALDALLDPANKITQRVTIPEGTTLPGALRLLSEATGLPLADFEAAAADYVALGVPAEAPSLEGYLFPATYPLDPGQSATQVLQLLVDEMFSRLDAKGVAAADRHRVLTLASVVQREAGPVVSDFYKISRVFTNRVEQGMRLQSDATVAYGTGNLSTVWTTEAERADASNLYNTYARDGLPVGPIGLPGDDAIDAALNPADGPWLFFVPINLKTGETVFSETADQHEKAAAQLRAWCRASDENASYCG